MDSIPGPATLWGILESNQPTTSASLSSVQNNDMAAMEAIRRIFSPLPNPARELFGDELENLETPRYAGGRIRGVFYTLCTSMDFARLNPGLFSNDYPHIRDVADPSLLLVEGAAALETQRYRIEVVVLVARGVPILVHVEMLRPLAHLYWMYVDPRDNLRYRVVHVLESPKAWKIAMLAVYSTEGFNLNDPSLKGDDYVEAIQIVQRWAGQDFVRDMIVDYFKSYCHRFTRSLREDMSSTPEGLFIPDDHERALREIERCFLRYSYILGSYRTLPTGAFGSWAVRTIDSDYLLERLNHLTHTFREEIAIALLAQAGAFASGVQLEEPIFLNNN
ncbi:hypothetical protein F5Y11DRAFT_346651 [Daldinia sp. FL1419]|nr:hypothetical protein F5Y11DRAFT_346651 [Daldinia sp. FL1419]